MRTHDIIDNRNQSWPRVATTLYFVSSPAAVSPRFEEPFGSRDSSRGGRENHVGARLVITVVNEALAQRQEIPLSKLESRR
jgi:hypothetical protein